MNRRRGQWLYRYPGDDVEHGRDEQSAFEEQELSAWWKLRFVVSLIAGIKTGGLLLELDTTAKSKHSTKHCNTLTVASNSHTVLAFGDVDFNYKRTHAFYSSTSSVLRNTLHITEISRLNFTYIEYCTYIIFGNCVWTNNRLEELIAANPMILDTNQTRLFHWMASPALRQQDGMCHIQEIQDSETSRLGTRQHLATVHRRSKTDLWLTDEKLASKDDHKIARQDQDYEDSLAHQSTMTRLQTKLTVKCNLMSLSSSSF